MYGLEKPEIIETAKIFAQIAPYLDDIFIAQMEVHNPKDMPINTSSLSKMSWRDYDGVAATNLEKIIDQIIVTNQQFLLDNPHIKSILSHIYQLIDENDPDKLKAINEVLVDIAIDSYKERRPIIWISGGNYWTHPSGERDNLTSITNPDAQLLIPLSDNPEAYDQKRSLNFWEVYERMYPKEVDATGIKGEDVRQILGDTVMWCGGEIGSYTSGENLRDGYSFIPLNILYLKTIPRIRKTFEILGNKEVPPAILEYVVSMYAFHENGHKIFFECTRELEELVTEIPTYIAMISEIINKNGILHHLDIETFIRVMLAENADYSLRNSSEFVAYKLSARYILSQLLRSGVIRVDNSSITFNLTDENLQTFMAAIKGVHDKVITPEEDFQEALEPHQDLEQLLSLFSK